MAKSKIAALLVAGSLILSSLVGCTPSSPVTPSSNNATPQSSINQGESSQGGGQQSGETPQPGSSVVPQPGSSANPQPSSQVPGPNSSNGPQPTSQPVGGNWTNAQISLMEGALYGLVLPYFEGANVTQIGYENNVYLYAFDVSETDFQNYIAKLIADGWDLIDAGAFMNAPAKSVYIAQRAIETANGTRYIVLSVGCLDGENYATSGMLTLAAQDPYIYTYNDAVNMQVNILANAGFSNIDLIPELTGVKYYSFGEYDEEEGALAVEVYINSAKEDAGLTDILKAANWIVKDEKNAQGFYIAYPPQNGFVLEYKYFAEEGVLELLFKPGVGWNELSIENFYKKYDKKPIAFPKLEIDGASYKFAEDSLNETYAGYGYYHSVQATMTVSHSSINAATVKNYVGELRKAGFVCNTYDEGQSYIITKMIGEDNLYYGVVELKKNGSKTDFVLTIRADGQPGSGRTMSWPTQKVAAALADATNDTLPAYNGVNAGFKTEINGGAGYVLVYLDEELAKNAVASYEQILKNNGFTLEKTLSDGQNEFHSRNDEIYARAFIDAAGVDYIMYIGFKYLAPDVPTVWPSEAVTKAIKNNLLQGSQITDTIPSFEVGNASECYVASNYSTKFEIRIEGIGASFAETVKAGLERAQYTYDSMYLFDTNQTGGYVSPNKQMVIHVYTVGNDVMLAVQTYFNRYAEWLTDIPLIIAGWGATDTVPAFEQAYSIDKLERENKEMDINILASDNNLAKAAYEEVLVKAGYKYDSELSGFKSPNGQLLIGLSYNVSYFVITVKYIGEGGSTTPITTGQWPESKLTALFGADFIIPKPNKTDISYNLSDENIQNNETMKMATIIATVTDGSAEAIINEFGAYLTRQYGYVYNSTTTAYEYSGQGMPNYMLMKVDENNFIIGIYVAVAQPVENSFWPEDAIGAFVEDWNVENDIIPVFVSDNVESCTSPSIYSNDCFHIAVYPKEDATIWTLKDEYIAIMEENGYTHLNEEFSYYYSDNGEIQISFIPGSNYIEIVFSRASGESDEEGIAYNSVLADFKAVTGIQLPQMEGLIVDEYPYEEGDASYCLDITGGENLSHDTFETLLTFLNRTLEGWEKEVNENESYYTVEYKSIYNDWIQLVWDIDNECVYLNAVMNTLGVAEAYSYEQGKALLAEIFSINLPNYEDVEIGDNSFAMDGSEATFAFSSENFTSATFDEIAAIFTRKFGDPYPEMSYSEEGYRSETWISEDMVVYSVYWDPENHSIDINIMIYTD